MQFPPNVAISPALKSRYHETNALKVTYKGEERRELWCVLTGRHGADFKQGRFRKEAKKEETADRKTQARIKKNSKRKETENEIIVQCSSDVEESRSWYVECLMQKTKLLRPGHRSEDYPA